MSSGLHAIVLSENVSDAGRISRALERHGVTCLSRDEAQAPSNGKNTSPDLMLIELGDPVDRALSLIWQLRRTTDAKVIVAGPTSDPQLILKAVRAGADDYINNNGSLEQDLAVLIQRLRAEAAVNGNSGMSLAVTGAAGGCGVSTIAANLAVALAGELTTSLLFDLKERGGDQAAFLNLDAASNLTALCDNVDSLDQGTLSQSLARHASGVHLLTGPQFHDGGVLDSHVLQAAARLLRIAVGHFPGVVADFDHSLSEEQLLVARECDLILLVFRLDFVSLFRTRRLLQYMQAEDADLSRVRLVANRYGQPGEIHRSKAAELLERSIDYFVPDDPRAANAALNLGNPILLEFPTAKITRSIRAMAQDLVKVSSLINA